MPRKKTKEEFVQEVKELVGDEYTVLGDYQGSKKPVTIRHNKCGHIFSPVPNNFLRGTRCPYCNSHYHKRMTNQEFLDKIKILVGNEYQVLDTYNGVDTKVRFKHLKCGNIFKMSPYCFIHMGQRCPQCSAKIAGEKHRLTTDDFKRLVRDLTGSEYIVIGQYKSAKQDLLIKHNKCGHIYSVKPYKFLDGHRCPYCHGSLGEKEIMTILDQARIKYAYAYRLPNKQHLDFYLPEQKIAIEYDGRQHFQPVDFAGRGYKWAFHQFVDNQSRDKEKNKYCQQQGIKLIRIPYTVKNEFEIKEYLQQVGVI